MPSSYNIEYSCSLLDELFTDNLPNNAKVHNWIESLLEVLFLLDVLRFYCSFIF